MGWKEYENWFKGAIDGVIIALIVSIGLLYDIPVLTSLASLGLNSCYLITQCSGQICSSCLLIGLMLNLIYGYIIGAIIGYFLGKIKEKRKNKKVNKKTIKNNRRKR